MMDVETLNLLMNFHHLEAKSFDLSTTITRLLVEEKVKSAVSDPNENKGDKNQPELFKKLSTSKHGQELCALNVNTASAVHTPKSREPKKKKTLVHLKKRNVQDKEANEENPKEHTFVKTVQPWENPPCSKTLNKSKETRGQQQFVAQDRDNDRRVEQDMEKSNPSKEKTVPTEAIKEAAFNVEGVIEIGQIDAEECDNIISILVKASEVFEEIPEETVDEERLRQEQAAFLAKHKRKGPDTSRRRQMEIKQALLAYFEEKIIEIVKFSKRIPGFLDLSLEDQVTLVRESSAESALIGGMRMINVDSKVFSAKGGKHFTMEEMASVITRECLEEKVKTSAKITRLLLCREEEALLRAITITATDREKLDDSNACQTIHNKLVTSLIHVIRQNRKYRTGIRFGHIVDVLTNLRKITELDMKQVRNTLLEEPAYSNRPVVKDFL